MSNKEKVLLIDAGNTILKVCLVENGQLGHIERMPFNEETLQLLQKKHIGIPKVLSSVLDSQNTNLIETYLSPCVILSSKISLPIKLDYRSPDTLGIDRLCNVCAIQKRKKTSTAVSIDIGTCIKFDVLEDTLYVGGSISPGIELRYRAMHEFTDKLPLLTERGSTPLTGKNSKESMWSGVINGIQKELDGFIEEYRTRYGELTFFITGGDAIHFDFGGKNDIFAVEKLTLEGMYHIYTFNAN